MSIWQLCLLFIKVGATTFGGGYAMLPILRHELVEQRHWLSDEELADKYALAQCMPGLIFINATVLIVRPKLGRLAAIAAAGAVALPSLVIILLIATVLSSYAHLEAVRHAFAGIRIAVAATVIHSAYTMLRVGIKDWLSGGLALAAFVLMLVSDLNPVLVIIGAAVVGVTVLSLREKRREVAK